MALDFELSENQISQMAQMLYLNLDDIKNYIETHQEEYNEFLKEEEQKEHTKQYKKFDTKDTTEKNSNKQKKYNTDCYTVWQQYADETVCKIKFDKTKNIGGI